MNQHTDTNLVLRSGLAIALALTLWSPVQAQSADPAEEKTKMEGKTMMGGKKMTETEIMQCCHETKELKENLAADLKKQDTELTAKIEEMNEAAEDKKLDLMADIVTQMVAQRTALNERKAKMEQGMMKHMMQHMQRGKESMAQCPMMDGKDSTGKSTEPGEATQEK